MDTGLFGMIRDLLAPPVVGAEVFDDPPELELFAAEEAVVARAVDKRRREFATVRRCARAALAQLGVPPGPILPGQHGAPTWPDGIVGSMTHCAGYRAAGVAWASEVRSVGIDAEPNEPLPEGVLDVVSLPGERHRLVELVGRRPEVNWDRLLFSAKEAVYKAWFPVTGRWLGFADAELTLAEDGTFAARFLVPGPVAGFAGRWTICRGLVGAGIVVPRESASRDQ